MPISDTLHNRHNKLKDILHSAKLDALVLNPGPSLTYLTGMQFHLSERPVTVLFSVDAQIHIVLPELEVGKLASLPFPIQSFAFSDDPKTWVRAYIKAVQSARVNGQRIGVEESHLRVLELRLLEQAAPQAQFISAEEKVASLRMLKDQAEIKAIHRAVAIAQDAYLATLPYIKPGVTEREVAAELTLQLLRHGSDPSLAFSPIVASGPNSANPHATPTARAITPGDLLVIDWGASYEGYISDLTRTLSIGEPQTEMDRIAQVVAEANAAGRLVCAPGITAGEVDRATRSVIEQAGYGDLFFHRTGHGIGMEVHEEPYIRADNEHRLLPGMTFTIEPGIYLPNRGGVRIEDNVVITETGVESLSDLPRELMLINR